MPEKRDYLPSLKQEILALLFLALGIFIFTSALFSESSGWLGFLLVNKFLRSIIGWGIFFFPVVLLFFSLSLFFDRETKELRRHFSGIVLLFLVFVTLAEVLYPVLASPTFAEIVNSSGGLLGFGLKWLLQKTLGIYGTWLILITLAIIGALLISNLTFNLIFTFIRETFFEEKQAKKMRQKSRALEEQIEIVKEETVDEKAVAAARITEARNLLSKTQEEIRETTRPDTESKTAEEKPKTEEEAPEEKEKKTSRVRPPKAVSSLDDYKLPPINLLKGTVGVTRTARQKTPVTFDAKILEDTLASFGVRAKVINITRGPAVTRFEVQPEPGIKVSQILRLSDDIALNLAAPDIRIETPIPGKSALGIEVPNPEITNVHLLEIVKSAAFQENPAKLLITLGKDIGGKPIIADLTTMPHLLIAGATGSGKSVCLNCLIISILLRARPDEVKFLMIDPKMVELVQYQDIPHLLAPVVTDSRKSAATLRDWVIVEMERRYKIFNQLGVRNIDIYHQKREKFLKGELKDSRFEESGSAEIFEEKLPYIVVIVDELADLMMVASSEVERTICRIAQMARATGIHLVISTQRPSVDVITGVIKANIPSRISFAVFSQVDSRTILDSPGAEKLLGRGDMLYMPIEAMKPTRIQGAFVSDAEIEAITEYIKAQAKPEYSEEILNIKGDLAKTYKNDEKDEFFDQAVELARTCRWVSTSFFQRKFRIGYNRAARLVEQMEEAGVVGPYEGENKPRRVLS